MPIRRDSKGRFSGSGRAKRATARVVGPKVRAAKKRLGKMGTVLRARKIGQGTGYVVRTKHGTVRATRLGRITSWSVGR